jgi:putative Mg2+ transporter-C (MgtC) family protein
MAMRLSAAVLLGGAVGLDREWRRKPAGMRTHMLVCLAAASFTVLAGQVSVMARELGQTGDPVRIVEAVTAGVAFLGAGTIFRAGRDVKGLSTGGSIWLVGAIGIACGAGSFALAIINAVLAVVILSVLGLLERREVPAGEKRDDNA